MEPTNPIDSLNILEKKVSSLVETFMLEREKNEQLVKENQELTARLEAVETSLLKGSQNIEELNQERVLTKMVLDELISNIDKKFAQSNESVTQKED